MFAGSDHKDEQINVMGFYGSSCYNGFTDEPDGFYNVYNDLFVQISQEDQRYVLVEVIFNSDISLIV